MLPVSYSVVFMDKKEGSTIMWMVVPADLMPMELFIRQFAPTAEVEVIHRLYFLLPQEFGLLETDPITVMRQL